MADAKISALAAVVGNGALTDEVPVNAAGTSKKTTLQKIANLLFSGTQAVAATTLSASGASTLAAVSATTLTTSGIATLGTGSILGGMSAITNSLAADVLLNNAALYFDGPSVAQGTLGTWFVSGTVTIIDISNIASFNLKLWDGTTVIASTRHFQGTVGTHLSVCLSGPIVNPAGNLRISVQDSSATTGKIIFNATGTSKDSTITAIRIG